MSQSESEQDQTAEVQGIADEDLPEDLQPDENPLAGGLEAGETVDDLMDGGKTPDESDGSQGSEGAEGASGGSQDGDDGAS
ncbi:hypothetical protein [Nocardioides litoris]|uniref:hypothetical protein n=1 Tax=Nocardioides litoris TaxID=1926648 RepID=UPI00111F85FD|nr:hypothetical protein [Nocardioides litoris]